MRTLDVWYTSFAADAIVNSVKDKETQKRMKKRLADARIKAVNEYIFPKLVAHEGGLPKIKDDRPLLYHPREHKKKEFAEIFRKAFAGYREKLPEHVRSLLDRFKFLDLALKVVGVGSVGTACSVMLLMANENDPLFLQVKEAGPSVFEPYAGKSQFANHGKRIVVGCRLMQSASDIFLGWTESMVGRHFYVRQFKDMKISPLVDVFKPTNMNYYAELCGRILARSHASTGEPARIAGYMGKSDTIDQAIADFSGAHADQGEEDHAVLKQAVRAGKLEVADLG